MTELETLQLAGKALGYKVTESSPLYWADKIEDFWMPHLYQEDSDCMACDLLMSTRLHETHAFAMVLQPSLIDATVPHDNTIEGRRAAVRQARLLVAVEIGRMK